MDTFICKNSKCVFISVENSRLICTQISVPLWYFQGWYLGFIVSKESKLLDPKKIQTIVWMHVPTNPQHIWVFNGMAQFCRCFIKNFTFIMAPITKLMNFKVLWSVGTDKTKICKNTYSDISSLGCWISCAYKYFIASYKCYASIKSKRKHDQPIVYTFKLLKMLKVIIIP
jgi:hypothetical protein